MCIRLDNDQNGSELIRTRPLFLPCYRHICEFVRVRLCHTGLLTSYCPERIALKTFTESAHPHARGRASREA